MSLILVALLLIAISVVTLCVLALSPLDTWNNHYKPESAPLTDTIGRVDWSTASQDIWNLEIQPKIRLAAAIYHVRDEIANLFDICSLGFFEPTVKETIPLAAQLGYLIYITCQATGHSITRGASIKIAAFFFFYDGFAANPDAATEELNALLPTGSSQVINRCFDRPELFLEVIHSLRSSGCLQLSEELAEACEQPNQPVVCPRPTVDASKID